MSAIYKLSIQGIRSFDSNDRETIEFGKPLTLIVGSNGSGKTTIIECLKYATSGDLPPNSKGGAFVHDPKITGDKDIRAQVKLAFTSANNLNMIVTRNIQLLVKKTTTTFKTLEGQLVIVNGNGNRNTLSTRSVELDTQVPLYMGVPKAILEYVIFCHQEDSLWPLSEPSNLKKKFDEIFQAMKFTKALDSLKGIKKDMSVDIKLLKQSVEHLRVDRDRSKATQVNISQLESKIASYQQEVKNIEEQLTDITEQSDRLFKSNQDFQKVLSMSENLKNNRESIKEQIKRLSSAIDLIDLPKPALEQLLFNFSSSLHEKEEEVMRLEAVVKSMKSHAIELQNDCNVLIRRQGELTANKVTHERNLETLKHMEQDLTNAYGASFGDKTTGDNITGQLKSIRNKLEQERNEFVSGGDKELKDLNKELSDAKHAAIVQSERLEYNKKDTIKLASEINRLGTELTALEFTNEDLNNEKESLNKFTEKLKDLEKQDNISNINLQIKDKNNKMIILENDLETLQGRISKTSEQADLFAKLSFIKKAIQEKRQELQRRIEGFQIDSVAKKLNLNYGPDIDIEFKKSYLDLQKNFTNKRQKFQVADKKYTEVSLKLTQVGNELKDNEILASNLAKKLSNSLPEDCPIEEYDDAVVESDLSYRTALENLKMHQTTVEFNKKALEVAEREDSCYLCSRKFETEQFRSSLLAKLRVKVDSRFEQTLKSTLKDEKEYLDTLRSLKEDILALKTAKNKIVELKSSMVGIVKKVEELKKEKDEYEIDNNKMEEDKKYVEGELRSTVEYFTRTKREVKHLEEQSKTISDELALYGTVEDGVKTVDELQIAQREKNEQLRTLRKEINHLQGQKETKSAEFTRLLSLIKERNSKVGEIERALSVRENIESDIAAKNAQVETLRASLQTLERGMEGQSEKVREIEGRLNNKKQIFDTEFNKLNDSLTVMDKRLNEFARIQSEIDSFKSEGLQALDVCARQLTEFQEKMNDLNENIESKNKELAEGTRKLRDSTNEKRNLKQNIEMLGLRSSLGEIEREISNLDVRNAEAERDKYQQESLRLRNRFEKLSSENAGKLGEIKQLQNQIQAFTLQLRTDYKDVDSDYHKKWVELQTRTFVTDDIDTYSKALDSAIMKYHGLKMQDINRIIDELWKRTYSGTDVDSIQIRSDEVSSNVKGKSYNYRVVMYKQDAELDMRGRCSAGQKVLASIIIRLALSETFGVNCGVIALDEPTTNLDEENIESLAKSLSNIIEMRRHQKNFQLIVITHDEKFLNHMDASQFTDHFFRVKRDDRQKSQIEWVDINKVTN